MTLQLLVNGNDYTAKWRLYESRWTMQAWQGQSAQSEFILDAANGEITHADMAARKIVEVWEDATGTPICIYRGRIANKSLGQGPFQAPGHAMRWALQCEDYNVELSGIRVINATRPEEDDDDRVEVIRAAYLAGAGSTHPSARDSTDLGNTYIGNTPAEARGLPAETYTDTAPGQVLTAIADFTGRVFFVYINDDGTGELVYMSRDEMALLSDISIVDDAEDEGADGVDVYAAYKDPQAGDHAGQDVLTGGAVRYNGTDYFEESDVSGFEAIYDKWETTVTNDFIYSETAADYYTNTLVAGSDESNTYFAAIDMTPDNVHRIKAGMMVPLIRKRANKGGDAAARAVLVTYNPVKPNADGETLYRVELQLGRPQFVRGGPRNRRHFPTIPTQPTAGACHRFYPDNTSPGTVSGVADDAAWDHISGNAMGRLLSTPDGDYSPTSQATSSAIGSAGGENIMYFRYALLLDSTTAPIIAAGGATIRAQFRGRGRYGIGISEAAQNMISQLGARVTNGNSTTVRGTALALHALTSSVGSSKWPAQATKVNKAFPPDAATSVLSAVPAAVSGDYLVLEFGSRNFTTVTSGGAIGRTTDQATDMPADNSSTATLNTWVQICTEGSGGSNTEPVGGTGGGQPGTSGQYAPIDHVHEHGLLAEDDTHYHDDTQIQGADDFAEVTRTDSDTPGVNDDEDDGYRAGDIWIDRTADEAYILTDATAGAAVWEQFVPSGGGGGAPTTADYLVGTSNGSLSAEIVVGTTPGGELGNTWASPTVDATHAGSNHLQPVRKNSTGSVFTRRQLNFIEGTNVTLTVADDAGNDEVDVTIAASGGTTLGFVSIAKWGND